MCKALKVSRSGYYDYLRRPKSNRTIENEALREAIKEVFYEFKGRYGSPRIAIVLNRRGISTSKNRVARHMKKMNLKAKSFKTKPLYYRKYSENVFMENLINQDFTTDGCNKIWLGDITYIPTQKFFLYLACFIDVYNRKIVGWDMSNQLRDKITINAFKQAYEREKPNKGIIVHTDRGSQFSSKKFQNTLLKVKAISSMSGLGNPYDNAVIESFFKTLKSDLINDKNYINQEKAKIDIFRYIETFYNRKRIHSSINNMSPIEFSEQ